MSIRWFLFLLLVWLSVFQVNAQYYTIKQFDIGVTFTDEGYADFEEVIDVEFLQQRHGILRAIPVRDRIDGKIVDRILKDVSVEGYKYTTYKENNNFVIRIGDADKYVDGRQVYRIHYRVLNPVNFFKDHNEFYWDLLGVSWDAEVENFSFNLAFPAKVQLDPSDVIIYTGSATSKERDAELQVTRRQVTGRSTRKFLPGEGLTIAMQFPEGTFKPMDALASIWVKHKLILASFIFLLIGVVAKIFARNKGQTIMTEYFPPAGISPAVAGGFIDHSVDNSDVLSLIPHLANGGYLRLEAEEAKGFFKKGNIIFHKLKEAGPELMTFEKEFFEALFADGDRVELDSLKDRFHTHMTSVQASVLSWIKGQGWYEPDQRALGCVTGFVGMIAIAWGAFAIFKQQNMDGIALGVAAFILFFFSSRFNKRTLAGNKTYQKLEGFRQFVSKAERPVIERLMKDDPLYYDKTMPFALAFGYLSQWNRHFEGLLTQPPSWYSGPMMYGSGMHQSWSTFSESFPSEINNIGSVFNSSPSSSSSGGGSGGGGFSGGGSGGGGGSSW